MNTKAIVKAKRHALHTTFTTRSPTLLRPLGTAQLVNDRQIPPGQLRPTNGTEPYSRHNFSRIPIQPAPQKPNRWTTSKSPPRRARVTQQTNREVRIQRYTLPLDWLDYIGLGIDVVERIYIELTHKEGPEKEFQRFVNNLFFSIDLTFAAAPGAGGAGVAFRTSREIGAATWDVTPRYIKNTIIDSVAKRMGWARAKASKMINRFFRAGGRKPAGSSGSKYSARFIARASRELTRMRRVYSYLSKKILPYDQLLRWTSEFNRLAKKEFPNAFEGLLLDAHHIIEKRSFKHFKKEFISIGWPSKKKMPAIAIHYLYHRRSAKKLLGIKTTEASSLSRELIKAVDSRKYRNIGEMIDAYEKFYREEGIWERVAIFFSQLRSKLGLPKYRPGGE